MRAIVLILTGGPAAPEPDRTPRRGGVPVDLEARRTTGTSLLLP